MKIICNRVNSFFPIKSCFYSLQFIRPIHNKRLELTSNIVIHASYHDDLIHRANNPIVLMYGWLNASSSHLEKYINIYRNKGYEIVQLKFTPNQILRPKFAKSIAHDLSNFLSEKKKQPILVHCFSGGMYFHIEHMIFIEKVLQCENLKSRHKGQIIDSLVSPKTNDVVNGISGALTDNRFIQNLFSKILNSYLHIFHNAATIDHNNAWTFMKRNPFKIPTLLFCSSNDNVSSLGPINELIQKYQEQKILTRKQCWDDTTHCSHYRKYPNEYVNTIDSFLKEIKFGESS